MDREHSPSFARVLHRLAMGESVSGAELLSLPGVAGLQTDYPLNECIAYWLDDLPELIEHAGRLAADADPGSAVLAGWIAEDLRVYVTQHDVVTEVRPRMRAALWSVGVSADLAINLSR